MSGPLAPIRSFLAVPLAVVAVTAGALGFVVTRHLAPTASPQPGVVSVVGFASTPSPEPTPTESPEATRRPAAPADDDCPAGCECTRSASGIVIICR